MLECLNCHQDYNESESTAIGEKFLYCSESCKTEDEKRLAEGNRIYENALHENPAAFSPRNSTPSGSSSNLHLSSSAPSEATVLEIVDGFMARLGKENKK